MVKIRLSRTGGKKFPCYRIVVADSRSKRDGRFIDLLGYYNPISLGGEKVCKIDEGKVIDWYKKGARPTDTVLRLIKGQGIDLV